MLGKLIKNEFKQTRMFVLCLAIGTFVLTGVSKLMFTLSDNLQFSNTFTDIFDVLTSFVLAFNVCALFFIGAAVFIFLLVRFYKNQLGDEGYLMFTLPATASQHLLAKTITATVWSIVSFVTVALSVLLLVGEEIPWNEFSQGLSLAFSEEPAGCTGIVIIMVLYLLLASIGAYLYGCLVMSIGAQWPSSRLLATMLTFIALQFIMQIVSGVLMFPIGVAMEHLFASIMETNPLLGVNIMGVIGLLTSLASILVSFFVSRYLLSKKLNLA